jgi:hypothetical protein
MNKQQTTITVQDLALARLNNVDTQALRVAKAVLEARAAVMRASVSDINLRNDVCKVYTALASLLGEVIEEQVTDAQIDEVVCSLGT